MAQDYVLTVDSGTISEGGSGDLAVSLDSSSGADLQGWSFGVCNDPAILECTAVVDGSTTSTVKNGSPPDFNTLNIYPEGWTAGVVICFTGCAVLAPGAGYELNVATYSGLAEGSSDVAFCDSLGSPPVATVVVVNGASLPPVQNSGSVDVVGVPDPEYNYHAGDASAGYNPADGEASVTVEFGISETDNSGLGAPFPNETQGYSMGVSNGPEVTPTAVNDLLPFTADFVENNTFSNGWTVGVVYSFVGAQTLAFPTQAAVASVDYETGGSMSGNEDGTTVALTWDSGLGSPPVANVVVVDGGSIPPTFFDGSITLNPVVEDCDTPGDEDDNGLADCADPACADLEQCETTPFIRGDVNADNKVNIADGVWIIYELFLNGPQTTCPIAMDANGDGSGDVGDAVYVLNYRFLDGPQPAAPFPDCGQDADQEPEDCASSFCG